MNCPQCQFPDSKVLETRASGDGLRRRRQCLACGARFTTHERVELPLPLVVKRGGEREPFSREKLLAGLRLACAKRPVTARAMEDLAGRVEARLAGMAVAELGSVEIGELVLAELENLDAIAWIRFASVFKVVEGPADILVLLQPWLGRRGGESL